MVLASTTMRPNDLVDIDEHELASWRAQGILLESKAETDEGRYRAALAQSPIDGPLVNKPAPGAVRADRSRSRSGSGSRSSTARSSTPSTPPAAKKAATPRRRGPKASDAATTPETAATTEAPATTEAATLSDEAPKAQKENETR